VFSFLHTGDVRNLFLRAVSFLPASYVVIIFQSSEARKTTLAASDIIPAVAVVISSPDSGFIKLISFVVHRVHSALIKYFDMWMLAGEVL